MSPRVRIPAYFSAAFFPTLTTALQADHLCPIWVTALTSAAAAGFLAVVAYFDRTDHDNHNPPPPAVPA